MSSVWDDPELRVGGEYVTFDRVGDEVAGTITAIRVQRFDDNKVAPQILLVTDDGEERTVTAGQVRLKAELATLRPEAGDHIRIKLTQEEKRTGGKTLKHWDVKVDRGNGNGNGQTPAPAPVAAAPAIDPAVIAAALAAAQAQPAPPPTPAPAPAATPAVDPAALAAALSSLTPEQRTSMGLPPY